MKKGFMGTAVLFFIWIVFEAVWLIAYPQNQPFIVGFGTLIGSSMLVFITVYYTYATIGLYAETQKQRETAWIEHRLKDLYFLLKTWFNIGKDFNPRDVQGKLWHGEVMNRFYLAEQPLREELDCFLQNLVEGKPELRDEKELVEICRTIENLVKDDIENMEKRLRELNG